MKKILMLSALMVVAVAMFSGCELLPVNESRGALSAAKDAAINAGLEWTAGRIAATAGEATGWGAIATFALMAYRSMRRKDGLLKSTGQVIEAFTSAEPEAGKNLKASLAKEAAKLPVDAKKEFGV